jgi:phosphoserine phosphatase RsbU/P
MNSGDSALALLREHVAQVLLGTVFSFVGLTACAIAAIRRRGEFRTLVWFGLFIGLYGARMLAQATGSLGLAPGSPWPRGVEVVVNYLLVVPGLLFWYELSIGMFRRLIQLLTLVALGIATLGLGWFFTTGLPNTFWPYNSLLAICMLFFVGAVVIVPALSRKYLLFQSRILAVCMSAIVVVAMYVNITGVLGFRPVPYVEPIAFAAWVFAIGYVAARRTFDNERRLLSIESELETARQIQFSILPGSIPTLTNLRISASYNPMSAVAGDFYQFIPVDEHRVGMLVADVSGHGVPAALISSMIKVAMQSVADSAADPAQVLRSLNRILSPELRGQLTTAAYLWIDTENHCARYSAAGHPPLLWWRNGLGELRQIESNGLVFGVTPDSEYPVCSFAVEPCDRFLLYTDGMVEPESKGGESFGERQLERVVRDGRSLIASELSQRLLSELQKWCPASTTQQDDITLVVVDVL